MEINQTRRLQVTTTALRGVMMVAAGIAALMFPAQAIKFVLLIGGGMLLVDGALGVAARDFSREHSGSFYLTLARDLLCILAGLTVLTSGALAGIVPLAFIARFVGVLMALAGLVEIASVLVDRTRYASPVTAFLGAVLYILFGLTLMFISLSSASTLMQLAAVAIIVYAASLLYRAWRIRSTHQI